MSGQEDPRPLRRGLEFEYAGVSQGKASRCMEQLEQSLVEAVRVWRGEFHLFILSFVHSLKRIYVFQAWSMCRHMEFGMGCIEIHKM